MQNISSNFEKKKKTLLFFDISSKTFILNTLKFNTESLLNYIRNAFLKIEVYNSKNEGKN